MDTADFTRTCVERAGILLNLEIALQVLFQRLPDARRADFLQVRMPLQDYDEVDHLVGLLHLLDRFGTLLLDELRGSPVRQ